MPRKVLVHMYMTLDGIAELVDSAGDTSEAGHVEFREAMWSSHWSDIDTILLGRRTYEKWAEFWPTQSDSDDRFTRGFSHFSTRAEKIVFSSKLQDAGWSNSRIVHGSIREEVARIRELPGKAITVGGGSRLVQYFLENDLADELYLAVAPSIVGKGRPLFHVEPDPDHDEDVIPEGAPGRHDYALLEARPLAGGTVFLHYRLRPKHAGMPQPSGPPEG